jgi:archaemetzincin
MTWEWTALAGGVLLGLLVHRWRRLYQHSAWRCEGEVRLCGTVVAPDGDGVSQELELLAADGARYRVVCADAQVVSWPGPGSWRWNREIRHGDRVTVIGLGGEVPGACRGIEASRVVRGAWPEVPPRLHWIGTAVTILAGILLLRFMAGPVSVEQELGGAPPHELLFSGPSAHELLSTTRRIQHAYDWKGQEPSTANGACQTAPTRSLYQYVTARPNVANGQRRFLYVQPIGGHDPPQRRVVSLTADFLSRYFCLPTRVVKPLPLASIPDRARRDHPSWGVHQLLTRYLLYELLWWRRPKDAAGYLGITATDIWPGEGWHSVYGQASLVGRVGVLSTFRNGPLDRGDDALRLHLLRTVKVAVHETGHIFSIHHCANHGCIMSGRNEREVSDLRQPVLCPHCLAKVLFATRCDPVRRYLQLANFCQDHQLNQQAALYLALMLRLHGL